MKPTLPVVLTMCGEVLDERLLKYFDPATKIVAMGGRPTRYIGSAAEIAAEVHAAGFSIEFESVSARKHPAEQDDLVIRATRTRP